MSDQQTQSLSGSTGTQAIHLPAAGDVARFVRDRLPPGGLFAGHTWRIAIEPFKLGTALVAELEALGRILLKFNRVVNLLYRSSVAGKQPRWVAELLDLGKPAELVALQRDRAFRKEVPRVVRPDIILTDRGWFITELDGVPGGIGLTAWLNKVYSEPGAKSGASHVVGGATGMERGFVGMFSGARRIHIVVSSEAATYRPEMECLASSINQMLEQEFCYVRDATYQQFAPGDGVYRFFELFDLVNVPSAPVIFELARCGAISLTPPPKPIFEEKLLFALLWNRNLRGFWRQELGERFFEVLLGHVPYTWVLDPTPLPPHGAIPELNITDWRQLADLSQRDRNLVIKISGFSPLAWGARSVALGSDMPRTAWAEAVKRALDSFNKSPYVLQRYYKPRLVETEWFDFENNSVVKMSGRVRLCPFYFISGEGDDAKANLGGVLVTICPADKKIIHGMKDAVLVPGTA